MQAARTTAARQVTARHLLTGSLLIAAVLLLGGCDASGGREYGRPTSPPPCNHMGKIGGDDDGALSVGFHFDEARHEYGVPVPIGACDYGTRNPVRLAATAKGITFTPKRLPAAGPRYDFEVTVAPGAEGRVLFEALDEKGQTSAQHGGPTIVTDGDCWRFTRWP